MTSTFDIDTCKFSPVQGMRQGDRKDDQSTACRSSQPRYLRKKQAAVYLSVTERTLSRLMCRRAVPYLKVTSRIVLFDVEELDRALRRYRVRAVGDLRD